MAVDHDKLMGFLGKVVTDMGAALGSAMVVIGEKCGLYKGLAKGGPMTSQELAEKTGNNERYVREWLSSQAAAGYVNYDVASEKFSMTEEQAFALAETESPVYVPGGFQLMLSAVKSEAKVAEIFKSGAGLGWHEHDSGLFEGTERFFRPGYVANLVGNWIPALDGVESKLQNGAVVADIGCGFGASTILMAKAFPKSTFVGFDYHKPSIEAARKRAESAGVSDRIRFEVARAQDFPGTNYDLVAFFDCLHDMGDPVGAASHVLKSLKKDGTWMIVEPFAHDDLEKNLNPLGRLMYSASTMICTPASRSQEVGLGLGAQAGEKRLRGVVAGGGFSRFRRASETPFNMVFEARP